MKRNSIQAVVLMLTTVFALDIVYRIIRLMRSAFNKQALFDKFGYTGTTLDDILDLVANDCSIPVTSNVEDNKNNFDNYT